MKNNFLIILLGLVLILGLFYWFQIRPTEIRKECFGEVYSENTNLEWAEGKEWMYYPNGKRGEYGWLYPYWRLRTSKDIYTGCLIFKGLK